MAMTQTSNCPSTTDFTQSGRQSLPPIHETLMPLRQTRPLPSLRDALSSGTADQQQSVLMCNAASGQSPLASSSSPNSATSTNHDSRTASSPRFTSLTTTSSLNGTHLSASSPTPQQPQQELGACSTDAAAKRCTPSQSYSTLVEGNASQFYAIHNHQLAQSDYAPTNQCQSQHQQQQQQRVQSSIQGAGAPVVLQDQRSSQQQLQPTYRYITLKTEPLTRTTYASAPARSPFTDEHYQPRVNLPSESTTLAHPSSQRVTYLVSGVSTSGSVPTCTSSAHMQRVYTATCSTALQGTQVAGATPSGSASRSCLVGNARQASNSSVMGGQQFRCNTNYVPVRTFYRSTSVGERKTSSRSSTKKEPMDAKNVEEEVARNVSQILSASLNQKAAVSNSSSVLASGLSQSSSVKSSSSSTSNTSGANSNLSGVAATSGCGALNAISTTRKYVCVDCQKSVSCARNLQRHRMSCKSALLASSASSSNESQSNLSSVPFTSASQLNDGNSVEATEYRAVQCSAGYSGVTNSTATNSSLASTTLASYSTPECMLRSGGCVSSLPTVSSPSGLLPDTDDRLGPECEDSFLESAVAELAQNDDLSMITPGSLASGLLDDERSLPPLAFNEDGLDVGPLSASEQTSFSNSVTTSVSDTTIGQIRAASSVDVAALYQCESCNKRVSSSRSLKRHRSTCKLYQLDFGHVLGTQQQTQRTNVANSGCDGSPVALGTAQLRSPVPGGGGSSAVNVCEHCNRSLCSASNLKRHRATCKAANARSENGNSMIQQASASCAPLVSNAQSYEKVEVDERERSILDRSYAAAVAASRQSAANSSPLAPTTRRRTASGGTPCPSVGPIQQQHTVLTTADAPTNATLKFGMIPNKPWITVGEHLRAQHNQRVIQQRQQQQLLEQQQQQQQQRAAMQQNTCAAQNANATLLIGGNMVQQASSTAAAAPQRNTLSADSVERAAVMQQQCSTFSAMAQFDVANATRTTSCEPNTSTIELATASSSIRSTPLGTTVPLTDSRQQPSHDVQNKQLSDVDSTPYRNDRGSGTSALVEACADSGEFNDRLLNIPVCEQDQKPVQKEVEAASYSSNKTNSATCFNITSTVSASLSQYSKNDTRPLVSIITTAPLTGRRASDAAPQQTSSAAVFATPVASGAPPASYLDPLDYRYECPECQKTYSCRKNVKRHRMAVHKLSPEDVAKAEPVRVLLSNEDPQRRQMALIKVEEKDTQGTSGNGSQMQSMSSRVESSVENALPLGIASTTQQVAPPPMRANNAVVTSSAPIAPTEGWSQSVAAYQFSEDDGAQLAKIEEDLRRSAEFKFANFTEPDSESEVKKPVAELAEADTTFNEECDDPNCRLSSSHPPSITSTAGMVSPSSGPSSNSSTCSSYPITSSNAFMHMSMTMPPTATASGFAAHLPPIKSPLSTSAPPPPPVGIQPQLQTPPLHIDTRIPTASTVVNHGLVVGPPQYIQQQQTRPQPPIGAYMQPHVVVKQKQPHICVDCNRTLSSDYSLKRHRSTCVEVKAAAAAAAKAASEAAKHAPQFLHEASSSEPAAYLISSDPIMGQQLQSKSMTYTTTETNARITRQMAPLSNKSSDMIMTQTFSTFDDDADNGVLCRVCDCWLPGQREFERHCDELHPVAADPDSTTVANSHDSSVTPPSAFLLSSPNSDIGSHSSAPYSPAGTRKRTVTYDTSDDLGSQCVKSGRHLCQACGKFYSSEWNLERHRRESCPLRTKRSKVGDDKGSSRLTRLDSLDLTPLQPVDPKWVDDCALVVGESRIGVSRSVLSRSSTYFASLFQYYDTHSDVPLPVSVDPIAFQQAVEVFKGTLALDEKNIDCVIYMADKFKLKPLYEKCEGFIAEKLPSSSVMHAIRLAEQYRMGEIKQALFDSISIDVFRSLAADEDYRQMGAELKAELLEKWGTFL